MSRSPRASSQEHGVVRVPLPAGPRKSPRQARSVALVDALKKTGLEILEKEGREALSVLRLSERSGVAVSSIYEYFPTMDSLIAAIFTDSRTLARQQLIEGIRALPPTATLFDGILLAVQKGMAVLYGWSRIDPELSIKSAYYDELVRLDLVKPKNFWSAVVIPTLLERFPNEIQIRNRAKALFLAHQALLAVPRAIVFEKPDYLAEYEVAVLFAQMIHGVLRSNTEGGAENHC